jgi:GT2 family glycosyltransferase
MSNGNQKTLSVVIVSYNVCDYVIEGIDSLYKFSNYPLQIIVVDNNSSDQTIELVKQKFPEVIIIANKGNAGFSAANNQGFEICTGDYILMFNPDALLVDSSINKMINEIEKNEGQNYLYGPKLINTDGSIQASCWKFPSPMQHLLELFFLNTIFNTTLYKNNYLNEVCEVDFLSGAFILMHRGTLKKLNGLDVNLFWMDDVDLCKRNIELGGQNIYYPLALSKHHIGQSSKKNQKIVISNQIISKLKFYKKHKQYFYFYSSVPILFLQITSRIPLFFILGILKKQYFVKAKAYFYTLSKFSNYLVFGNQNLS